MDLYERLLIEQKEERRRGLVRRVVDDPYHRPPADAERGLMDYSRSAQGVGNAAA